MSKTKTVRPVDSLSVRMKEARKALTDEELRFFPKTDPMLNQPEAPWGKQSTRNAKSTGRVVALPNGDSERWGVL